MTYIRDLDVHQKMSVLKVEMFKDKKKARPILEDKNLMEINVVVL